MTGRRGFTLLAVLWVVVALGGIAARVTGTSRGGVEAAVNRIAATRARWAAEACVALALDGLTSRQRREGSLLWTPMDTLQLPSGAACDATAAVADADTAIQSSIILTADGWIGRARPAATIQVQLVGVGDRVAVVRRLVR